VVATGDADGNGLPDVVVRSRASGHLRIWFTQLRAGGQPRADVAREIEHQANTPGGQGDGMADYEVQGGGDFDGDDRMDLLVRDAKAGDLRVWYLDGATLEGEVMLTDPGANWVFESVGAESPSTHR
jgi:hypothetical protein